MLNTIFFFSKISSLLFLMIFIYFHRIYIQSMILYHIISKGNIFLIHPYFSSFPSPPPSESSIYSFPSKKEWKPTTDMPIGGYKFYRDLHIVCMGRLYGDKTSNLYLLYQKSLWVNDLDLFSMINSNLKYVVCSYPFRLFRYK